MEFNFPFMFGGGSKGELVTLIQTFMILPHFPGFHKSDIGD